jgi:hypothetical protein
MPPRRLVFAFLALWLTLGLVLLVASVRTFMAASGGSLHAPGSIHLALLAGVEAMAAALFLLPPTMRLGGSLLLVTFAVALLAHAHAGEFRMDLLLYAAGTAFVMVHGPVPRSALRARSAGGPVA